MPQQQQKNNNANNFMSYFNSKVLPLTKDIEGTRSKIITGAIIWAAVVMIIPILIILVILTSKSPVNEKLLSVAFLFIGPLVIFVVVPLFNIKQIYGMFAKEKIMPTLLGFWGRFTYVPPMNLASAIYKAIKNKTGIGGFFSELFKDKKTNISVNSSILARLFKFDHIIYDDKIVGQHADVNIEIAELSTVYTTKSRDREENQNTSYTTFKGVVFSAKMNKKFKGITLVSYDNIDKKRALRPKVEAQDISTMSLTDALSFGKKIAGVIGAVKEVAGTVQNMQGQSAEEIEAAHSQKYNRNNANIDEPQKLQDVYLEDPLFNRKFKMCSTDQIEARYIFTTAFMNRFMKIAEKFGYRLHAIFIDDNVYIFVASAKNWFEIPFFKPCSDPNNYREFLNDFSRLLGIVETLKLNQNIGM